MAVSSSVSSFLSTDIVLYPGSVSIPAVKYVSTVFLYEKIPASKLKNPLDICTIQLDSTQDNM